MNPTYLCLLEKQMEGCELPAHLGFALVGGGPPREARVPTRGQFVGPGLELREFQAQNKGSHVAQDGRISCVYRTRLITGQPVCQVQPQQGPAL